MSEKLSIAIDIIDWLVQYKFKNTIDINIEDIMFVRNLGDEYFYIEDDGIVNTHTYNFNINQQLDMNRFALGNCFKTEEQARHMLEKLRVINELKKFALENNYEKIDWFNPEQKKWRIVYDYGEGRVSCDEWTRCIHANTSDIYFTDKKIAEKAIDTIDMGRIRKYYLDV